MIIGAHVSTAGGLTKALENGRKIKAEALQIFPSAPLRWKINGWSDEAAAEFKAAWPKEFKQVIFHGIYLANLAADLPQNKHLTRVALTDTLNLAAKLGIVGTIFHPGNYKNGELGAKDQIKTVINEVLDSTPSETKLIYENSAGGTIGGKLEDLVWLLEVSKDKKRVGVCLDTCHAFAAGYDISNSDGYEAYIKQVDKLIGLENVFCWHLNDSKFELGAKRDRHENIGQGKLGDGVFKLLVNDQRWQSTVGYLEVPGFDNSGPDLRNVELLKKLRS